MGSNFTAEAPRPTLEDLSASWRAVRIMEMRSDPAGQEEAQALSRVLTHYTKILDAAALASGAPFPNR